MEGRPWWRVGLEAHGRFRTEADAALQGMAVVFTVGRLDESHKPSALGGRHEGLEQALTTDSSRGSQGNGQGLKPNGPEPVSVVPVS